MLLDAVIRSGVSGELDVVLLIIAILGFIGFVVWAISRRTIEPWWRKYPKPSKLKKICKDMVAAYEVRKRCPQAFDANDPLYMPIPEQRLHPQDMDKIAEAVVKRLATPPSGA